MSFRYGYWAQDDYVLLIINWDYYAPRLLGTRAKTHFFSNKLFLQKNFFSTASLQNLPYLFEDKSHFFVPKYRLKSRVQLIQEYMKCIEGDTKFF